eukprot:5717233-Amphidinium_carterae.4
MNFESDVDEHVAIGESAGSAIGASPEDQTQGNEEKRGRGRPKKEQLAPKAKSKAKAKARSRGAGGVKQCDVCRLELDALEDFYESQARCKSCSNTLKSMERAATSQGWEEWQSKKNDKKFVWELMREFKREQSKPRRAGQKIAFNFHEYYQNYFSRESVRRFNINDMMTEGDFMDHAMSQKGGSYTRQEAQKDWQKMMEDAEHPKDNAGPRGMLRCKVFVGTRIEESEEVARERGMKSLQKLGKNTSDTELAQRFAGAVVAGNGEKDFIGWSDFSAQTASAMARSSKGVFEGDGLLAANMSSLAATVAEKGKKPKALQQNEEEEEKEEEKEADEHGRAESDEEDRGGKKWFDQDKHTNAALRRFQTSTKTFFDSMSATHAQMVDVIRDIQSVPSEGKHFESELTLVDKRRVWLQSVGREFF